jgi:hypothetical protein
MKKLFPLFVLLLLFGGLILGGCAADDTAVPSPEMTPDVVPEITNGDVPGTFPPTGAAETPSPGANGSPTPGATP